MTPTIVDIPLRFAHCQLVLGDVPTLVDAGMSGEVPRILRVLAEHGLEPRDVRRILLTHADADHAGGVARIQALTGAEVVVHEDERAYLLGEVPGGFGLVKRAVIALSGRVAVPHVDRWVSGGEHIDGFEVVATPGHTPGHLSFLFGRTLLAGDAFVTGDRCKQVPTPMSADVSRTHAVIRALAERDVDRAFSGHGHPTDDAKRRIESLASRLPA